METARGGDFTVAKHEELEDLVDDIIATLRPRLSRMDGNDKRQTLNIIVPLFGLVCDVFIGRNS